MDFPKKVYSLHILLLWSIRVYSLIKVKLQILHCLFEIRDSFSNNQNLPLASLAETNRTNKYLIFLQLLYGGS